jgi:hypothetical protein
MADPQEDAEELAVLGRIAKKVHLNNETRRDWLKLVQKVEPETPIAELEAEKIIEQRMKPLIEKNAELEKRANQLDAVRDLDNRRNPLRIKLRASGVAEQDIEKTIIDTEKVMIEKKIGDYEVAYDWKTRNETVNAPAKASAYTPTTLPSVVDKEFFKDPAKGALNEAAKYFQEKAVRG